MTADARRSAILKQLHNTSAPLSASALAESFNVSRQIIVGDVALLRASGADIIATPRGYLLQSSPDRPRMQLACNHNWQETKPELYALVDEGCTIVDVIVEHPVYGQLTGLLGLSNRHDVDQFLTRCQEADAIPLSRLTEGIHLHTIEADSKANLERAAAKLKALGIVLPTATE